MPNWNDIKKNIGNLADKTAAVTRELTDVASLKIKIANKESDRDHEYKHLGKLAYARLRQIKGFDAEQLASDISASLERLDTINKELAELKAIEKSRNDAKAADKKAKETKKAEAAEKKKQESEKLNLEVMDQFNNARTTANEEYQKAKEAAEDAKAQD